MIRNTVTLKDAFGGKIRKVRSGTNIRSVIQTRIAVRRHSRKVVDESHSPRIMNFQETLEREGPYQIVHYTPHAQMHSSW